jgi:hypothetical protein
MGCVLCGARTFIARIFNKDGTPSRTLALATRQIDEWRSFISGNPSYLKNTLFQWTRRKDILKYSSYVPRTEDSSTNLVHPDAVVIFKYVIVIGRRSSLETSRHHLLGRYEANHGITLATYDRLLDLARRRYGKSPTTGGA